MITRTVATSQRVDILSEERASMGEVLPEFRRLTVDLPAHSSVDGGSHSIQINHGTTSGALALTLNRTIRVPDNGDTNMLPPSLGQFPLFKVQDYAGRMPSDMAAKGGLFFPMYQREAMWINFHASQPFALKIYVGGVNAISGLPMHENEKTRQKRLKMQKDGKQIQDYMIVPGQPWLDGIVSEDGKIRQFIAKPKGSGFSVEVQVTGEEKVGGVHIEIIPAKFDIPERLDVRYENRDGHVLKRTLLSARKGLSGLSTLFDLKKVLREEFDIAIEDQVLENDSTKFGAHGDFDISEAEAKITKLGSFHFMPNTTLLLSYRKPQPQSENHNKLQRGGLFAMEKSCKATSVLFSEGLEALPPQPPATTASAMPSSVSSDQASLMFSALASNTKVSSRRADTRAMEEGTREKASAPISRVKEMGLAAGGYIQQTIVPDPNPASIWDLEASILLNLQILDSEAFSEVTGLPPPPTPVDTKTYQMHGYPFFEIWGEEKTGVCGEFGEVKSVAQIEAERAAERGEEAKEEESVPQRVHIIGKFRSTFRPVEMLEDELNKLKMKD